MGVETGLVTWITDYLTERPQFVRLGDLTSETVVSSTGAPQGTVLSPLLFTLYTTDFNYNSETCHMQKFSDDTTIVGCIKDEQEGEYRGLVENFVRWCRINQLQLNTTKTKEMVVDFRRTTPPLVPVSTVLRGRQWRQSAPTNTWGYIWTINWTGLQTHTHSTRKDRAGSTF